MTDLLKEASDSRGLTDEFPTPGEQSPPAEECVGETERLIRELKRQQTELELQNEELRRSYQQLEKKQEYYLSLYELAPVAYFAISRHGLIRKANLVASTLLQKPRSLLLKEPFSQFIVPEDRESYDSRHKSRFDTNEPQVVDLRIMRGDGQLLWARLQTSPSYDGEYWIALSDISKQKEAETSLLASRASLKATLDATADGILAVDSQGKTIFYNQQFSRLWKIPPPLLECGDDAVLLNYVLEQLAAPEAFMAEVTRLYHSAESSFDSLSFKDGRVFECYSFPLNQTEYQLAGRVWSFRDVTDRRRTEEELRSAKGAAETANLAKRESATIAPENVPVVLRNEVNYSPYKRIPPDNGIRLLLTEDEPTNRLVLTSIFKKLGYDVDIATNGQEALDALTQHRYDAVLMDCMMPVMSGYEATAAIRDPTSAVRDHDIPIIALTANAFKEDREKCLASGMNDFVCKPVDIADLLEKLHSWLPHSPVQSAPLSPVTGNASSLALPPKAETIFDLADFTRRNAQDYELCKKVAAAFIDHKSEYLEAIRAALKADDPMSLIKSAHKLKGAAGNISLIPLSDTARRMESHAENNDCTTATQLLPELERRFEQAVVAVQKLLMSEGSQ